NYDGKERECSADPSTTDAAACDCEHGWTAIKQGNAPRQPTAHVAGAASNIQGVHWGQRVKGASDDFGHPAVGVDPLPAGRVVLASPSLVVVDSGAHGRSSYSMHSPMRSTSSSASRRVASALSLGCV